VSAGTFAAFSKFHLNTSNSPNVKVVYFVMGHNFHVEWHWRFGVEEGEKCKSAPESLFTGAQKQPTWHANCAKKVEKNHIWPL
jgi:hypothetical protein